MDVRTGWVLAVTNCILIGDGTTRGKKQRHRHQWLLFLTDLAFAKPTTPKWVRNDSSYQYKQQNELRKDNTEVKVTVRI